MKNFFKNNFLTTIGWVLSFIWLMFVASLLRTHNLPSGLNAVGDFVAGMASPLAFLWVVIGYYQSQEALTLQAKELSQSSEALVLQVVEMRKTKEVQELQLEEMRQQYVKLRKIEQIKVQPFLHITFLGKIEVFADKITIHSRFNIKCINGYARNISLRFAEVSGTESHILGYISKDHEESFTVGVHTTSIENLNNKYLDIIYFDINNLLMRQRYRFFYNMQETGVLLFDKFIFPEGNENEL